jgi:hypothetical protein
MRYTLPPMDRHDSFGWEGRTPNYGDAAPTLAQMIEALNADTPENNRRNAAVDAAVAQIERAFGPKRG